MSDESAILLGHVTRALDQLIATSQQYDGLFPSMMNRADAAGEHHMLTAIPEPIEGQRQGDRTIQGSNLTHDQPTLATLLALGQANPAYAQAADRYLKYFANQCTVAPTGLFPWGEHSYWDLVNNCPGNSYVASGNRPNNLTTHDHLRACPLWLWKKLNSHNPDCVQRFAAGLINHWTPADENFPLEYNRHAYLDTPGPCGGGHQDNAPDFPRHGGFYIFDWTYAYTQSKNPLFLQNIQTMLDYWWEKRQADGLLYIESREYEDRDFHTNCAVAQTLSLASSLLESANLLDELEPALAEEMRKRARVYMDGHFNAPHEIDQRKFLHLWHKTIPSRTRYSPIWGSTYGKTPVSYSACNNLCIYRLTGDERALTWAAAAGMGYLEQSFPEGVQVPAMDAGMALELLADLYDITQEQKWLDGALKLAHKLVSIYFEEGKPLPRGAAGIDWYESQMGPGFLLHGLARTALLAQNKANCPLKADYTGR